MELNKKEMRELDAWIAERVMGWKWFSAMSDSFLVPPFAHNQFKEFSVHWTEGVKSRLLSGETHKCKKNFEIQNVYSNYEHCRLPHYTTDPAAAMQVLEKCVEEGRQLIFGKLGASFWVMEQTGKFSCDADSVPLAICLAAKKLFS